MIIIKERIAEAPVNKLMKTIQRNKGYWPVNTPYGSADIGIAKSVKNQKITNPIKERIANILRRDNLIPPSNLIITLQVALIT